MTGSPSSRRRPGSRLGRTLGLSLLALLAVSGPAGPAPRDPQADPAAELLARILEKTEAYCRRLGRVSLDFVCRERIDERQYDPPRLISAALTSGAVKHVTRVSLEYDYQLIRKGDVIEEKRTLLKEGDKPAGNEPGAVLKTKLYKHRVPGLRAGRAAQRILAAEAHLRLSRRRDRRRRQSLRDRSLSGGTRGARSGYRGFSGGAPGTGIVYGKAWIRKKGFRHRQDRVGPALARELTTRSCRWPRPSATRPSRRSPSSAITAIEKNGIRFPDRLVIREDYRSTRGTYRVSEATVRYEAYRFFVVETEVRY